MIFFKEIIFYRIFTTYKLFPVSSYAMQYQLEERATSQVEEARTCYEGNLGFWKHGVCVRVEL